MEHRRPNGDLARGWFCAWCGKSVSMAGHSRKDRETGVCTSNVELVVALQRANTDPKAIKPHFKYKAPAILKHTMLN